MSIFVFVGRCHLPNCFEAQWWFVDKADGSWSGEKCIVLGYVLEVTSTDLLMGLEWWLIW